jgi:hypothetical protein
MHRKLIMTKTSLFLLFQLINLNNIVAQKKTIKNDSYENWTTLKDMEWNVSSLISNDGKYIAYKYGAPKTGDFIVIRSTDNIYKKEFKVEEPTEASFTGDSRKVMLKLPGDSLGILTLGSDSIIYIKDVSSFSAPLGGNGKWLAFINSEKELTVKNLISGSEKNTVKLRSINLI